MPKCGSEITETAKAKINLTLEIRGRRPDGYHDLVSIVAFAEIGDTIVLEPEVPFGLHVDGPFATAIDGENLIEKTHRLVRAATPEARPGRIRLTKNLPVAAGLGGGSADAAAVLRAFLRAEPMLAQELDLPALAAKLGADVTVCLAQRSALMWGIGERIELLPSLPPFHVVLANPGVPLSTAAVFRHLDAPMSKVAPQPPDMPKPFAALGDLVSDLCRRGNGLQATALRLCPDIGVVLEALQGSNGCLYAAQSGSGPTCFGLFADAAEAKSAECQLRRAHANWWVVASVCHG